LPRHNLLCTPDTKYSGQTDDTVLTLGKSFHLLRDAFPRIMAHQTSAQQRIAYAQEGHITYPFSITLFKARLNNVKVDILNADFTEQPGYFWAQLCITATPGHHLLI